MWRVPKENVFVRERERAKLTRSPGVVTIRSEGSEERAFGSLQAAIDRITISASILGLLL